MQLSFQQALTLAIQQHQAGAAAAAEQIYRQLLAHAPGHPELLHLLGVLRLQCQAPDEAVELLRQACATAPQREDFRNNLGLALQSAGQPQAAIEAFEAALALRPDYGEASNNLGNLLRLSGSHAEALTAYQRAAELLPGRGEIQHHLALVCEELGQLVAAGAALAEAARLLPESAAIWTDLAQNLLARGLPEQALSAFERAQALAPEDLELASASLFCRLLQPDADLAARQTAFRAWGARMAAREPALPPLPRRTTQRLRIGVVCSNFSGHSSRSTLLPLYRERDPEAVELYSYAAVRRPDAATAEFKALSAVWHEIGDWSDQRLAGQIRADGIDILLDFNGHTLDQRLACFARRPAPVQLTGLGFGASTGLAAIDYRLADRCMVPPEQAALEADRVWYLPLAFCYQPPDDAPAPAAAPRLHQGFITFGSGNRIFKLNQRVLETWAGILHDHAGSRLRLKSPELDDPGLGQELRERFAALGIAPERIDLLGRSDRAEHLAFYNSLDIALDPFPYDGGISSCDTLWMGVPVLSLAGPAGQRCAVTLLTRLGLADWLAPDPEAYRAQARALSADSERLDALRQSLRARLAASALCDTRAYTRAVEAACSEIWQQGSAP